MGLNQDVIVNGAAHEFVHPAMQPVPLKVIIIGAGASGLVMAYKIQRNFDGIEVVVYEKNAGMSNSAGSSKMDYLRMIYTADAN